MKGFKNALNVFKWSAKNVPAYKKFLRKRNINPAKVRTLDDFKKVQILDKKNYLLAYPYRDLFPGRKLPPLVSMSSGSSGKPFYWSRGFLQEERGGRLHEIIFRDIFKIEKKQTLVIVAFSMGTWIAGAFTANSCRYLAKKGYNITIATPGIEKEDAISLLQDFAPNFEAVILAGYPPFLMDIIVEAKRRKINLKRLNMRLLFAGENFSEKWRGLIHKMAGISDGLRGSISVYGSADADSLGHETPLSIFLRKKAEANKVFKEAIFHGINFLPTLVSYYPQEKYFEAVNGELIFTAKSGIPLIRYNIHDKGSVMPYAKIAGLIKKFGLRKEIAKNSLGAWKLPFVTLGGRSDVAVTFYALNIYPENIKAGLEDERISKNVTGKFVAEHKTVNYGKNQKLIIRAELKRGQKISEKVKQEAKNAIVKNLVKLNIEYRKLFASIGDRAYPQIELKAYGDPMFQIRKSKHKWIRKA